MKNYKVKDLPKLINSIKIDCKKGELIFVHCKNEKIFKVLRKELNKILPNYRGIYTFKGIVVVAIKHFKSNIFTRRINIED